MVSSARCQFPPQIENRIMYNQYREPVTFYPGAVHLLCSPRFQVKRETINYRSHRILLFKLYTNTNYFKNYYSMFKVNICS